MFETIKNTVTRLRDWAVNILTFYARLLGVAKGEVSVSPFEEESQNPQLGVTPIAKFFLNRGQRTLGSGAFGVSFSSQGDKLAIVYGRNVVVISLTGRTQGNFEVSVNFQAEFDVVFARLSENCDRVVLLLATQPSEVISLTETDEKGKPKVLARFLRTCITERGSFSPDCRRMVITTPLSSEQFFFGGEATVISLTETDRKGHFKVLAKYQIHGGQGYQICTGILAPSADKMAIELRSIGDDDKVLVISWDERGDPRVLVEYQLRRSFSKMVFSSGGDKVLIVDFGRLVVFALPSKDQEEKSLLREDQEDKPVVLAEYEGEGGIDAIFSPQGDKLLIVSGRRVIVISLIQKDEKGKTVVLADYEAEDWIDALMVSPDGDKVVISFGKELILLSLTRKDEEGKNAILARHVIEKRVLEVVFSPQGNMMAVLQDDGSVEILKLSNS